MSNNQLPTVNKTTSGKDHTPYVEGPVTRQKISRTNDYAQAGDRYRAFSDDERDDLILNLINALKQCNPDIQQRMIEPTTVPFVLDLSKVKLCN